MKIHHATCVMLGALFALILTAQSAQSIPLPTHPGGPGCPAAPHLDSAPHMDVAPFSSGHAFNGNDACNSAIEFWHIDDELLLFPDLNGAPNKAGGPIATFLIHGVFADAAGAGNALVNFGFPGGLLACANGGAEVGGFCRSLVNLTPFWAEWHTAVVEADLNIAAANGHELDPWPSTFTTLTQLPDGSFSVTQKPHMIAEPAALGLFAVGLVAVAVGRRRRTRR